eukprot:TRINITY_DN51634_c0_g1_i1.p1 TRINITY_DN51634_c0_g1~~TRINITY_DN51634_c0_g1_i1.p1  ORF type:complete len:516 (-),score=34.29 TRINITY_DN51634_c0_g1_i1:38-1456(-)
MSLSYLFSVGMGVFWFTFLFGAQTLFVKVITNNNVKAPWFVALLLTCAWPVTALMLLVYCLVKKVKPARVTWRLGVGYCVLGILDATHMVLNSFSLHWLLGSTYMLLKSTSLFFNLCLSWAIAKKQVTLLHLAAVESVLMAVALLAIEKEAKAMNVSKGEHTAGVFMAVTSGFINALHTVLSSLLLKNGPDKKTIKGVIEVTSINGLISSLVIAPIPFIVGEYKKWDNNPNIFHTTNGTPVIYFYLACAGTALGKQLGYFAKFHVSKVTSGLGTGITDSFRRICVVVAAIIFFHEPLSTVKVMAIISTCWGLMLYTIAGWKQTVALQKEAEQREADQLDVELDEEAPPRSMLTDLDDAIPLNSYHRALVGEDDMSPPGSPVMSAARRSEQVALNNLSTHLENLSTPHDEDPVDDVNRVSTPSSSQSGVVVSEQDSEVKKSSSFPCLDDVEQEEKEVSAPARPPPQDHACRAE